MEKEINDILTHKNTIQDQVLSEKLELLIKKQNNATIPSIILEYLSPGNDCFELENLKEFFNHFGEVLNLIVIGKKIIVLFKTFFIAYICKEFFQNEKNYKENKKDDFIIRWFDFEKDENLLISDDIKIIFKKIYQKNVKNLNQNQNDNKSMNNQNNNNSNNNLDIKMNMNMNINNFNINTTMNPMGQNQNMMGIPNMQYLQLLQLAKMNMIKQNNNAMPQGVGIMQNYNLNPMGQMSIPQQNPMNPMIPLNMLVNKQSMNNNINNLNLINNINNNLNNNINIKNQLINQNFQQMNNNNQQYNRNLVNNNFNQSINNNNSNNNDEKIFGKYTCKYEILIANDKDFQIARRLIGKKGCNMKNIRNECKLSEDSEGIKLRLRGKGSGYKEGPQNKESDEPLHLCISSKNAEEMKKACLLVDELLNKIHEDYKEYCQKNNIVPTHTQIAARIDNKNSNYKSK